MANFDHYEFYKEIYFKEQERRQEVSNALNIPLAIITGLIAGFYVLITTFSYEIHWSIIVVFVLLLLGAVGFLCAGIWWLVLAFATRDGFFKIKFDNVFEYKTIDFLQNIHDWHAQEHAANMYYDTGVQGIEERANDDLKENLIIQYIEKADHNATVNDLKLSYIFNCKMFLIYSLLLSAAAFLPYLISFFWKPDEIHKIHIESGLSNAVGTVPKIDSPTQNNEQSIKQSAKANHAYTGTKRDTTTETRSIPAGQGAERRHGAAETAGTSKQGNKIDNDTHSDYGRTTKPGNSDTGAQRRAGKTDSISTRKGN